MAVPAVPNELKVVVGIVEVRTGSLCLNEESNVAEIRREKCVIGAPPASCATGITLNLDFLLVRV